MNNLLFFSAVDNDYEKFLILYIYFANKFNKNSCFEFLIKDLNDHFAQKINEFKKEFKIDNILLRAYNENIKADRLRFLCEPIIICKYTYIGDVDIFINEPIKEFHINRMIKNNTIYDNCIRPENKLKLSGLHFVKTKEWYNLTRNIRKSIFINSKNDLRNDEMILFDIVKKSNIKIHDDKGSFNRPLHGLHLSLNRVPFTDKLSFPIDLYKSMFIDNFLQSDDFLKLKQYLSEDMINIINTCTNYVIQNNMDK